MEEFADVQNVQYFECELDHANSSVNELFTTLVDNIVDSILSGGENFESENTWNKISIIFMLQLSP